LAIVGQPPFRVLGERSAEAYAEAERERRYGGENGWPVPLEKQRAYARSGRDERPSICFVLTTGRSGSTTIAQALNTHPLIKAAHEPRRQLIKLSTEYAHGDIDREELKDRMAHLFLDGSVYHRRFVYVEADQKYFNVVSILNELFPASKFIWLVRSADRVVASSVGRGWYSGLDHPVWKRIGPYWHDHRLCGDRTGHFSTEEWQQMSPFEKNCWYWQYVNQTIKDDLSPLPSERRMLIRLEDLSKEASQVLDFLNVPAMGLPTSVRNAAFYKKYTARMWDDDDQQVFWKWCGPLMRELYPEYRLASRRSSTTTAPTSVPTGSNGSPGIPAGSLASRRRRGRG
jgi:hypothetical protein